MKTRINRRGFLSKSATAGAGLLILRNSRLAFAYEANSKLNIAGIGVGGQGRGSLDAFYSMGNNLVALCDVDAKRAGDIYEKHPEAKPYQDFRKMFDQMEKQIDFQCCWSIFRHDHNYGGPWRHDSSWQI